jgi:hypothetical protein
MQYAGHIGFVRSIEGLPVEQGLRHTRLTLIDVDPDLLRAIEQEHPRGVTVMLATTDGLDYVLTNCEAVAISPRRASVLLAVGEVAEVRVSRP